MDLLKKASYTAKMKNTDYKMKIRKYERIMTKYQGTAESYYAFSEEGIFSDIWGMIKEMIKTTMENFGWAKEEDDTNDHVNKLKERSENFAKEFKEKMSSDEFKVVDRNGDGNVAKSVDLDKDLLNLIHFISENDPTLMGENSTEKDLVAYAEGLLSTGINKETVKNNLNIWAFKYGYTFDFRVFSTSKDDEQANDVMTSLVNHVDAFKIAASSAILRPIEESKTRESEKEDDADNELNGNKVTRDETPVKGNNFNNDEKNTEFTSKYEQQNNFIKSLSKVSGGSAMKQKIDSFKDLKQLASSMDSAVATLVGGDEKTSDFRAIKSSNLSILEDKNRAAVVISFVAACTKIAKTIAEDILKDIVEKSGDQKTLEFNKISSNNKYELDNGRSITEKGVIDDNSAEINDMLDLALAQNNMIKGLILSLAKVLRVLSILVEKMDASTDIQSSVKTNPNTKNDLKDTVTQQYILNKTRTQGTAGDDAVKNIKSGVDANSVSKGDDGKIDAENEINRKFKGVDPEEPKKESFYLSEMNKLMSFWEAEVVVERNEDQYGNITSSNITGDSTLNGKNISDHTITNKVFNNKGEVTSDDTNNNKDVDTDILRNKHNKVNQDILKSSNLSNYKTLGTHWRNLLTTMKNLNKLFFEFTKHNHSVLQKLSNGTNDKVVSANAIFKNPKEFQIANEKLKEAHELLSEMVNESSHADLLNRCQKMNQELKKWSDENKGDISPLFTGSGAGSLPKPVKDLVTMYTYRVYVSSLHKGLEGANDKDPFFVSLKVNGEAPEVTVKSVKKLCMNAIKKIDKLSSTITKSTKVTYKMVELAARNSKLSSKRNTTESTFDRITKAEKAFNTVEIIEALKEYRSELEKDAENAKNDTEVKNENNTVTETKETGNNTENNDNEVETK